MLVAYREELFKILEEIRDLSDDATADDSLDSDFAAGLIAQLEQAEAEIEECIHFWDRR